ncbi:LOW QUALITY PROTEIN: hypothetical protein PHMEG_0005730 [Phytophthora megakarya]|uniref:Uncharacterized protein n=1 Tax=Phytophthora megakarya TaxID=4795 RepID=A0A225WRZ6_9STRA|nr:LOW QUALITY PROTEIN: hypothetical protein PHMEG_0005730 [Phytophthora megakarya]
MSRRLHEFKMELIASIVENSKDVTLIELKKKLLKEYQKKEPLERVLKATSFDGKGKSETFGKS